MAYIWELEVSVKADKQSLNNTTKTIKKELKTTGKDIETNLKDWMDKWSKEGASALKENLKWIRNLIIWIFAIDKIKDFAKELLGLWSDLTEISSKFDVVFDKSQKVRDAFYQIAEATNRSKVELLNYWALIWDVLTPLGLQKKEIEEMSKSITKLSIDVASFNNAQDSDVLHAFLWALTGETEALKTYGIVIHQTDIQQEAYRLGLTKQWQQLTKAQQALATYNLLLKNTKNAQWDAVRTSYSFANQLKWLKAVIQDTFAFAWKEVALQTAWFLAKLTTFIKAYWQAIIKSIVEIGKTIWTILAEAGQGFWLLFHEITQGTNKNINDTQRFSYYFLKSLQAINTWIKWFILIIQSLGKIVWTVIWDIIIAFYWLKNNAWKVFNSIEDWGVWLFQSLVDTSKFWVKSIWEVFVWLWEAVLKVFENIAVNVGVAFKKAWNLAIGALNDTIGLINKIPGVNISKLTWFKDSEFKAISLWISKHLKNIWNNFSKLSNKVKKDFKWFNKNFWELGKWFSIYGKSMKKDFTWTIKEIKKGWTDFWTDIALKNLSISKSIEKGWRLAQQWVDDYDTWFYNITQALDKYKGWLQNVWNKQKHTWTKAQEMANTIKEAIQNIKNEYSSWKNKIKEIQNQQKQLNNMTDKFNEKLTTNIRELTKEIQINKDNYLKAIDEIKQKTAEKLATRWVDLKKSLEDVLKTIKEYEQKQAKLKKTIFDTQKVRDDLNAWLYKGQQISGNEVLKRKKEVEKQLLELKKQQTEAQTKLNKLEQQKTKLLKEQQIIQQNTTWKQRQEAFRQANLTPAEKIQEEAQQQIEAKRKEFEAEKQKQERLRKIYKAFQQDKIITQQEYTNLLKSETFNQLSVEEQRIVMQLAKERMAITQKQQMIKQSEQEIYNLQLNLSNSITTLQLNNIWKLKKAYSSLIANINKAIAAQRALNRAKHSKTKKWFSTWWYTGMWWIGEIAGVVHKWERVAPARMVNNMKPMFDYLENLRGNWFKNWWYTINKRQTNQITVNSEIDLRSFLDYAKWQL